VRSADPTLLLREPGARADGASTVPADVEEGETHGVQTLLAQVVDGLPLPQHVVAVEAVVFTTDGGLLARHLRGDLAAASGSSYDAAIDGGPGLVGTTTIHFSGRGLPGVDQLLAESCAQEIGRVLAAASTLGDLRARARRDPLTGLANRAHLEDLAGEVDDGAAVVFVDLDGFKGVNDTHGHRAGDGLLVQVAERLRGAVRSQDVVARFGGDEFVVLVRGTTQPSDATVVAQKVREVFADAFDLGDATPGLIVGVGASVGLARSPEDGRTLSELLAAADGRMYDAKRGRP
jgi:diguanylate cyclase (GGDEF)-like protein